MSYIFPLDQVSLPIVGNEKRFPVRRIYCVGRNYLDHIRETTGPSHARSNVSRVRGTPQRARVPPVDSVDKTNT